ncbi:hypothetical protein [Noviherbaspirillum pedocola]|uniref:Uncharacterized protein n=1 Tax=Noviherbaspirillum pedocola TaxID=2801341 RepID=A0A934STJ2_9BURK|nr:hypothetical protein [Noviherbaspirillum pedocola]MBK4734943.1 hypothetical protein [Noviherbaspirillum pedocola]
MKRHVFGAVLCAAILVPALACANDFPTSARVEYVLECMKDHGGKQEYLYKCSCAVDRMAEKLNYEDFLEAETALRYQGLGGERGGAFRDPPAVRKMAKSHQFVRQQANAACLIK